MNATSDQVNPPPVSTNTHSATEGIDPEIHDRRWNILGVRPGGH